MPARFYDRLWLYSTFCVFGLVLLGCAELKEWLASPETEEHAQEIVVDAVSGNWAGAGMKAAALGLSLLLTVLGVKKGISAVKARRASVPQASNDLP